MPNCQCRLSGGEPVGAPYRGCANHQFTGGYDYYAVPATAETVTVSAAEVPVSVSETVSVSVTVSGSVVVGAGLVVVSAGVSEMMTACMPIAL